MAILRQSFDRGDGFSFGVAGGSQAGTAGHAVDENGASAALTFTAAVFSAGEIKLFAENREQGRLCIGVDFSRGAVDEQASHSCHRASLRVPGGAFQIRDLAPRASIACVLRLQLCLYSGSRKNFLKFEASVARLRP